MTQKMKLEVSSEKNDDNLQRETSRQKTPEAASLPQPVSAGAPGGPALPGSPPGAPAGHQLAALVEEVA